MQLSAPLLGRWVDAVTTTWGPAAGATARAATDPFTRTSKGGNSDEVLGSVAEHAASNGIPLDTVFDWVEQLAGFSRPLRRHSRDGALWAGIAARWAAKYTADTDEVSGFDRFDVLRSRLRAHYQLCDTHGVRPEDTVLLVVISFETDDAVWTASAIRRMMANAITSVIAGHGKIITLLHRDSASSAAIDQFVAAARDGGHESVHLRTEPLASTSLLLGAHLDQLESSG